MAGKRDHSGLFKKGDPRIRHDAHKIPSEVRAALKLTREQFVLAFEKYCFLTITEIQDILKNNLNTIPAIEAIFVRAIATCLKSGDMRSIDRIFDRILGAPKQTHEVYGKDGGSIKVEKEEKSLDLLSALTNIKSSTGESMASVLMGVVRDGKSEEFEDKTREN